MEPAPIQQQQQQGPSARDPSFLDKLKLSNHPITLVTYLVFRSAGWVVYFLGMWFTKSMIMVFIITILLLAADFYYLKNIAGRRLVGLRWWNEVDPATGDSKWVFESREPDVEGGSGGRGGGGTGTSIGAQTDSKFFWMALYVQPVVWVVMAVLALVRLQFTWLPLVAIALVLAVMNTLAFSRCDKFSQASNMAGSTLRSTSLASRLTGAMVGRWLNV